MRRAARGRGRVPLRARARHERLAARSRDEHEPLDAAPTLISKLNTLVQILLVILVVCDAGPFDLPDFLIQVLVWTTLATTLLSGVDYVVVWNRLARSKGWRNKPGN